MRKIICFFWSVVFLLSVSAVFAEDPYRIYALACPFQTVTDEISVETLKNLVSSAYDPEGEIQKIYLSAETAAGLNSLLGDVPEKNLADNAAERIEKLPEGAACALIPLDEADPPGTYIFPLG